MAACELLAMSENKVRKGFLVDGVKLEDEVHTKQLDQ